MFGTLGTCKYTYLIHKNSKIFKLWSTAANGRFLFYWVIF